MAIDPVKIPQNVYIEDRIVGPLTLRQTIIVTVGGGISYSLYGIASQAGGPPNIVLTAILCLPLLIAIAFAFVKINDLSMMRLLLLTFERINKPPVRTWTPRRGIVINIRTTASTQNNAAAMARKDSDLQTERRIQELSSIVDRGVQTREQPRIHLDDIPPHDEPEPEPDMEEEELNMADETPLPLPVDPSRVQVDKTNAEGYRELSDLSVFRDVFRQQS